MTARSITPTNSGSVDANRRVARLPGRALLTGASSGIGLATARHLLIAGWKIVGLSRRLPELDHPDFEWLEIDLADVDGLDACLTRIGAVDAFVHSAGIMRPGALGDMDPAVGQSMWRLHVEVAVQIMNRLVSGLPIGGRVVLVGSRTAAGSAGRSQYAATKAALYALARSWAKELVAESICINVVAPGATRTPMLSTPERASLPPSMPPMGRFIDPEEVAGLVGYLLSSDTRSLTGQQIVLCAGASL